MIDVLGVFEAAWGQKPSKWAAANREITRIDLKRLVDAHHGAPVLASRDVSTHEIWPLISHHPHGNRNLFAGNEVLPRVLALLLTHDGIVAADPLVDVVRLADAGKSGEAVQALSRVVPSVAAVEPLITSGILKVTSLRPKLTDFHRVAVLAEFGIDEHMLVFTNFLEAAVTVAGIPGSFEREYRPQVVELFQRFGLPVPALPDVTASAEAVRQLAAAVIEVSWQFAVCAQEPSGDLALSGPVELSLAEQLLSSGLVAPNSAAAGRMMGKTRHVARFDAGNVPNLRTDSLRVADAIAIRRDDTFAAFRDELRSAVDQLDRGLAADQKLHTVQMAFEERMRVAADELGRRVQKTSFGTRVRDTSLPTAVGMTTALFVSPNGPAFGATGVAAAALTTVVWQWLTARRTPKGVVAGRRYFSMLGEPAQGNT